MVYHCNGCESFHLQPLGRKIEEGKRYVRLIVVLQSIDCNVITAKIFVNWKKICMYVKIFKFRYGSSKYAIFDTYRFFSSMVAISKSLINTYLHTYV